MKTESSKAVPQTPELRHQEPLRAVVFDYGGVLTYLPTEWDWKTMASIAGVELPRMLAAYWLHRYPYEVGRYDSAKYWGLVARDCGVKLSDTVVRELVDQDNEQWGRPNPETMALARRLRSLGMRTALLSNMQPDMLSFVGVRHPCLNEFEVRIISCEVAEAKPEPAIFTLTAERLHLPPQECLFLDDRELNIQWARSVGMRAIHFESAEALVSLTALLVESGVQLR
jgi:putative hydrolase of the HAD superfamily